MVELCDGLAGGRRTLIARRTCTHPLPIRAFSPPRGTLWQPFSINLSAPFIPQFFKDQLDSVLPYTSLVIGNESEAEAYAESHNLGTKDLKEIAQAIAKFTSQLSTPRTVVITHGAKETIVVQGTAGQPKTYAVNKVNPSDIVDTNGAGDAFAGGLLGALILGKSIDDAVEVGHKLGAICIGQSGPTLKFRG